MIATAMSPPYYHYSYSYSYPTGCSYQRCLCSTPFCNCWTSHQQVQTYEFYPKRISKQEENKRRMEAIPRRTPHIRVARAKTPNVRPSIQALSMRIK